MGHNLASLVLGLKALEVQGSQVAQDVSAMHHWSTWRARARAWRDERCCLDLDLVLLLVPWGAVLGGGGVVCHVGRLLMKVEKVKSGLLCGCGSLGFQDVWLITFQNSASLQKNLRITSCYLCETL